MADNELLIKIGADAKAFADEIRKVQAKTKDLEKGLATAAKVSAAGFAALTTSVGFAVSQFVSFEKTFTNVQTLLDKSSFSTKTFQKGINDLKNDVLKLGAQSGESFDSLNKGLFDLVSAGVPAERATTVLADAVNLATAGATDTATAVKALTAAITAYGAEAGTSSQIAEKFFTAQKFGVTTVGELATEFNKVGGFAKQLGIGFNEALAAATALTANGAKPTAQAFTEFKAVLNSVILAQGKLKGESEGVQKALSLQNIEQVGIVEALNQLKTATGGNVVTMQRLLGSSEALSAALSLTGAQTGTFKTILTNLNDEQARAAAFQDALATKQATTEKAIARLTQSFSAAAITLGEQFAPTINSIADAIGKMAQEFSELDENTKQNIVTAIKFAAAITAGVTAVTTGLVVLLKFKALLAGLAVVFPTLAAGASAFWVALTGPIGLAVAGMAAVAAGIYGISKALEPEPPKTLDEITKKLEELKKKRDAIPDTSIQLGGDPAEKASLDEDIKKLEELRKAKIAASEDFGTGSLLVRPEADTGTSLGADAFGIKPQAIPFAPAGAEAAADGGVDKNAVKAVEDTEKQKTAAVDKGVLDRINKAKKELEVLKARNNEATNEEIGFIQRKQELRDAEGEANLIKNEELRAIELEKIRVQNEALLAEQQEYFLRKQEQEAVQREQEAVLKEELNALDDEQRALLREKELEELQGQVLTKEQIRRNEAKQKLQEQIKERNQFLADEQKHGIAVATLQKFLNSQEVQGVSDTATRLAQLQNSKNKTLKDIGKKAALAQIAIDTARGAIAAYTSLAGLPIVGPVLGAAAAAALIAYGAEQVSAVNSAQRGGIVPNAIGGARDRVPTLLEPGELVVPRAIAPDFIQSVGRPDTQNNQGSTSQLVQITIEDDATDFISAKQRENTALNIGVAS